MDQTSSDDDGGARAEGPADAAVAGAHDEDLLTEAQLTVRFDVRDRDVPPAAPGARGRWSSPLPVGVRRGSDFGPRSGGFHAGDDFPPPRPAQQGVPVHAVADGVVSTAGAGILPGHSGQGVLIDHGGGVRSYSGHLASFAVRAGERVSAGSAIGVMGWTGNVRPSGPSGTHLHLGVLVHGRYVDPSDFLAAHGIAIGGTPPLEHHALADLQLHVDGAVTEVQTVLSRLGYYPGTVDGAAGEGLRAAVRAYQLAQLYPVGGLRPDGDWGPVTRAHHAWVLLLQRTLNAWAGADIAVDGDYGRRTGERVREVQRRNHGGAYPARAKVDGDPGRLTCTMLGIPPHP